MSKFPELALAPASPEQAAAISALRDELAEWMLAGGIDQWQPGQLPADEVATQIADGEWFTFEVAGELAATVRIIWSDPAFWGVDEPAGYVHGVMVAPGFRGAGYGAGILDFAAAHIRAAGHSEMRLDTAAGNAVLNAFYVTNGFTLVGTSQTPERYGSIPITLYSRPV